MRVKYTDQNVKWENNGETIEIHIENIIFADFDKDKNVIFEDLIEKILGIIKIKEISL